MAAFTDFVISRITPDQIPSAKHAEELVDVFGSATNDDIYNKLKGGFAEHLMSLVHYNSGILHVARLKGKENSPVVGIALFKLRFGGWRDPHWDFTASSRQTKLHADIFAGEDEATPIKEFTGDPVLDGFKESLEIGGQAFPEMNEDLLILEPVYILPQYQQVEGLPRALIQPVMKQATSNHIKVIAYNRLHYHDYSSPQHISSVFAPLYKGSQVRACVDTRETPDWTGPEIIWDQQFQLFSTGHGQDKPYPASAFLEWA